MAFDATARRRWLGALALAAALLMLLGGETVFKGRLSSPAFLVYWLACFCLTGVALGVAFWDARVVARRTLEEQRDLFHATLKEIEREARDKRKAPASDPARPPANTPPSRSNGSDDGPRRR